MLCLSCQLVALHMCQLAAQPETDCLAGAGLDGESSSVLLGGKDRQVVRLAGQVLAAACAMDLHSALQSAQTSMHRQQVIGLVEEVSQPLSSADFVATCSRMLSMITFFWSHGLSEGAKICQRRTKLQRIVFASVLIAAKLTPRLQVMLSSTRKWWQHQSLYNQHANIDRCGRYADH